MTRPISLFLSAFVSLAIALMSYRFLALGLHPAFPEMVGHIDGARLAFLAHISAAPVALAIATFQLMPRLRARRPGLHRWMGRAYALAILIGGLGALGMLPTANGGPAAQVGFGLLALGWLGTTAIAVFHARARRFDLHRRWMIRSFALTFAAVTLRLEMPVLMAGFGLDYPTAIVILGWLCWLPNLALAELVLTRNTGWKTPLLWLVLAAMLAIYLVMLLWSLPHLAALAGGAAMFDLRPTGYDLASATALIAALGAEGQGFYLTVQQGLDTAFPMLKAVVLILAFFRLYPARLAAPLGLIALVVSLCDELENAAIAAMLRAGAEGLTDEMVATASHWTQLKSAGDTLLMVLLLIGLAWGLWRRWRDRA